MKKIAGAIISIGLSLSFLGCSWEVPQNISVKTNANYNFYLGKYKQELNADMNLSEMMGVSSDTEKMEIFDYFPEQKDASVQQFGIKLQVYDDKPVELTDDQIDALAVANNGKPLFPGTVSPKSGNIKVGFNPAKILDKIKGAIGDDFANKLDFKKVTMYLYVDSGDMEFSDLSLTLETQSLLNYSSAAGIGFASYRVPSLRKNDDNVVITDVSKENCTNVIDITDFMNNCGDNDDLKVDYVFGIKPKEFPSKQALKNADLTIRIYAILIVPVTLKAKDVVEIDLAGFKESSSSSGGSSSGDSDDNSMLDKYLGALESVDVNFVIRSFPIQLNKGSIKISTSLFTGKTHEADLSTSTQTITLESDEISNIKNLTSVTPSLAINIAKDAEFSLPRNKDIDLDLGICLKTNGEISLSDN